MESIFRKMKELTLGPVEEPSSPPRKPSHQGGSSSEARKGGDSLYPTVRLRKKSDLMVEERHEGRRASHSTPPHEAGDTRERDQGEEMLFLPVDVDLENMKDWSLKESKGERAVLVKVNHRSLAVFRFGSSVLATDSHCPHAGGPLHLGDIEVLPDRSLCLRCPSHRWAFCLGRVSTPQAATRRILFPGEDSGEEKPVCVKASHSTGRCVRPDSRSELRLRTYPVRLDKEGRLSIGFQSLHRGTLVNESF